MKYFKFVLIIFILNQSIIIHGDENTNCKEYQIKLDNNENIIIYFLSENSINGKLNENSWILIKETKGHFWKFYKREDLFLIILSNSKGLITNDEYIVEMAVEEEITFFDTIDINEISFYYILRNNKLNEFVLLNETKKIEVILENINQGNVEYYKLNDGRCLEIHVDYNMGYIFMNKEMMDNWHKILYYGTNDETILIQ
jgi:hypothetical protein